MTTSPVTAPLFAIGSIVGKKENFCLMFWTVEEILATQGTYCYRLEAYKHHNSHLGGWVMEKDLDKAEKLGNNTPKYKVDELVIYQSELAPYSVARIVEDDVGAFRYYLHGTGGQGATWASESGMSPCKMVAEKSFDERYGSTKNIQIGTLTHANMELQITLDRLRAEMREIHNLIPEADDDRIIQAAKDQTRAGREHYSEASRLREVQRRSDDLRNRLVRILSVNPDNDAIVTAVSAAKGVHTSSNYVHDNLVRLFGKNDRQRYTPGEMLAWVMQLNGDYKDVKQAYDDQCARFQAVKQDLDFNKDLLRDLRLKLSMTLNCDANDASIFAKVDYVKNLAFNPAKYRVNDEVEFNPALLEGKAAPLSTVTKVKETLPQSDGSYFYKLEAKLKDEHMVVKEKDLRPVIIGAVDVIDIYIRV